MITPTFKSLSEVLDFETLFDAPINSPPPIELPFSGPQRMLDGELSEHMEGAPVSELAMLLTGLSLEKARDLVDFGSLWINRGQVLDPDFKLPGKGTFRLSLPEYGTRRFYETNLERIVFEDSEILVYNKESGRPSQAVPQDAYNNVLSALTRLRGIVFRLPHRLDQGTSGLLMLSKNKKAAAFMGRSFQKGIVKKRYLALSEGPPPDWRECEVKAAIAKENKRYFVNVDGPGYMAHTQFRVLGAKDNKVLFLAIPLTGRTHQIRLHLKHLNYPIIGDYHYGGKPHERLMLMAAGLKFIHPETNQPVVLGGPWDEDD